MGNKNQNKDIDISGKRFGRLVAIKKVKVASWLCKCDCGEDIIVPYSNLIYGCNKSCGCWRRETMKKFGESAKKHGGYGTTLYGRYCQIKQRCYNPKHPSYHRYGGRGIMMCKEWEESFDTFREWAYSHGYDEGNNLSIDRIDNDGDYSPDNCRFATRKEQQINQERTRICCYKGKNYSAWGFAKEFGITSPGFAYKRIKEGKLPEEILEEWEKVKKLPSYLITVHDAAVKYGKTEGHIRRMLRDGTLKGEKINAKWYVDKNQE